MDAMLIIHNSQVMGDGFFANSKCSGHLLVRAARGYQVEYFRLPLRQAVAINSVWPTSSRPWGSLCLRIPVVGGIGVAVRCPLSGCNYLHFLRPPRTVQTIFSRLLNISQGERVPSKISVGSWYRQPLKKVRRVSELTQIKRHRREGSGGRRIGSLTHGKMTLENGCE